jgi:hypothetical protein
MDTCSTLNNKIRKARIRIVVYVLMLMMLRSKKNMYYGPIIQEIWELDFHCFKIPLSVAIRLMQSGVLYKTSMGSLTLTLIIKDISQNLSC